MQLSRGGRPEVRWERRCRGAILRIQCLTGCVRAGCLQRSAYFRTVAGGRGHPPGTEAPEAAEWLVARLGSPRLTWRIGEQASTQAMSKVTIGAIPRLAWRLVLPAVHTFPKKAIS
jgi:hypothetical protein